MARSRIDIQGDALEHQSDADLAVRAANGDREAFEELYRRHSRTAMRVAYRVTGNIHDASDAVSDAFARVMQALPQGRLAEPNRFRSYLLTSTRHAAVDVLRRAGRSVPSDYADDHAEPAQTTAGPSELLMDQADNALVAAAFRALPERWRSVLWLTEVEGIPAREAAGMLGVSPNGVAQLAVRARAGLRERYLQAHLPEVDGNCRDTVRRLGAYVGGALAPRDVSRVDQHLASCEDCRVRRTELAEIGTTLRKAAVPLPLAVGGAAGLSGLAARIMDLADRVGRAVGSLTPNTASGAPVAAAGAAAAAVFVASVAGVGMVNDRNDNSARRQADTPARTEAALRAPAASPTAVSPANAEAAPATAGPLTADPAPTTARTPSGTKARTAPSPVVADTETPGEQVAKPQPTTSTTAPPPVTRDDDPPPVVVVPEVPDVPQVPTPDLPDVPDDVIPELPVPELPVPTLPVPLPTLPTAPELGLADPLAFGATALPVDALTIEALSNATDFAALMLWLRSADAPLPSPDAPGLPV